MRLVSTRGAAEAIGRETIWRCRSKPSPRQPARSFLPSIRLTVIELDKLIARGQVGLHFRSESGAPLHRRTLIERAARVQCDPTPSWTGGEGSRAKKDPLGNI